MKTNQSLAKLTPDATLSQIISADQKAGELLSSIGLEPSDHKEETLRSVCRQRQWSEVEVLQWVKQNRISGNGDPEAKEAPEPPDFGKNLSRWCTYIEDTFHKNILKLLGEIGSDFPRIHQVHGNQYIWLKSMQWYLDSFDDRLQFYIYFESRKFFPLVRALDSSKQGILDGTLQKLNRGLEIICEDQKELLKLMHTLETKGRRFENPPLACSTLRILNYNLKTLCSKLKKQFEIEREKVLPMIKQKIKDV